MTELSADAAITFCIKKIMYINSASLPLLAVYIYLGALHQGIQFCVADDSRQSSVSMYAGRPGPCRISCSLYIAVLLPVVHLVESDEHLLYKQ